MRDFKHEGLFANFLMNLNIKLHYKRMLFFISNKQWAPRLSKYHYLPIIHYIANLQNYPYSPKTFHNLI